MATLINGNGNEAVYAQQDADLYTGALGEVTRILNVGSKLVATIEDSNTIAVADGVILTKEGRRIQVDVGNIDEFTIPTGQAGTTRYYIFGYHLYTDGSANQKCETFVQLMADGSETIPEASFREGATEVYVSLYRVKQDGLTLDTPAALLSVGESMTEMGADIAQLSSDLTALDGYVKGEDYEEFTTVSGQTWIQFLSQIYNQLDLTKVSPRTHIVRIYPNSTYIYVYRYSLTAPNYLSFTQVSSMSQGNFNLYAISFAPNTGMFVGYGFNLNGTFSGTVYNDTAVQAGETWRVVY